jgi:hypothetical protein
VGAAGGHQLVEFEDDFEERVNCGSCGVGGYRIISKMCATLDASIVVRERPLGGFIQEQATFARMRARVSQQAAPLICERRQS